MADIYVFARSNRFPDISTYGECGALTPTECKFTEVANGDSVITFTHPIDKEFERYKFLQNGALIAAKVPVKTTPEIQNGVLVTTVYRYKVNEDATLSSKTQRALFTNKTGDSKIGYLEPGSYFTVVYMPNPDEHQSSSSSSSSSDPQRWKVKSDLGTGWINPSTIAFDFDKEEIIANNSSSIETVQSPWKNVYQLFRIYEVQKSLDSVQVSARHWTYDLLYNVTRYNTEEAVDCQTALDGILDNCITKHDFIAYTNVGNENAGLFYEGKNPIEAFLDPEEGICAKFNVQLVRDNYELYFLNDPGLNRGVSIEYAKNMTGVTVTLNEDEIATRIVPVGENEDGSKLYLSGGSASEDYAKMQNVVLKYTSDSNYSYQEEVAILKARLIELGYTDGISSNNWNYMTKTKENVIRWQNDNNRSPADGIYNGERDFTAMFSTDPYPQMNNITLQNGSRGDNVKTLQQRLTDLGYNVGSTGVDGIFGDNTESAVRAWESDNGVSSTTGIYTATRVITGSKTMYSMLFTDISGPYIDSPYINDYPTVHTFYLECENCKVGEEEDDGTGTKKKLTVDIVKARMKQQAQKLLDGGCDRPKVSMSVEYQNLGDTEEYKQFQGLENVYLYDYVTVRYPELDINILARVNKITWDVLLERQESIEIGELAEQLGETGVCTWQLPSGINGGKILTGSINGNALSNGTFQDAMISDAAIERLNANSIVAVEGQFNKLTTEELYANALYADVAKIVKATVEHLDASLATIDFANIRELSADDAYIRNLDAGLVTATKAIISTLMADSAYVSALSAQFAHITNAMIDNANINFGTIKYLSSDQATIESLFTRDANQEDVFIKHLKVLQAQMLDATIGNLTLRADDGDYYKLDITFSESGVPTITPRQVTPTTSEINAGMMSFDGSRIVETTLPHDELAVGTFKAFSAFITKLNADTINATHFFANDATIGALTSPLISTAVVRAIEGALDFWASDRINFRIDDIDYSPSQLINDTMNMNANNGWRYGTNADRYQQGTDKFWRARITGTGYTSDSWIGVATPAFNLPTKWQGRSIVVSADIHSDAWTGLDRGITWSLSLTNTEDGTPARMLYSSKYNIVMPGQSKWGADAANKEAGSTISGNWNRVYVVFPLDKTLFDADTGHTIDEFDSMTKGYISFYVRRNGNMILKQIKVEWGTEASEWTASSADQGELYTQLSISNDRIYAAVYDTGISSAQLLRKTQQMNLVAGDTTGRYWKNASGSTDVTQPNFITRYSVGNSEQVRMRIRNSTTGWLTVKSPAFPIRDLDVGDILTLSFYGCIYYPSSGATAWNARMQAVIVPVDESSMGGFVNNSLFPSLGTTHDLIDADRTFGDADMNHVTTDPMPANNVFTRFRTKFTVSSTLKQYSYAAVFIRINGAGDFAFHSPKLERSEVATQWTAHPAELNAGSSIEIDKDGVKIKTSEFSVSLPSGDDTFTYDNNGLSAGHISSQSINGNVVNTYTGAQYVTFTTKGDLKNYISNSINGHYLPQKVYLEMRQGFTDTTNLDIFGVSGEALTIQRYRSDTGTKPNISGKVTVRSCSAPIIFNNVSLQNSKSTSTGEGVINTYACSFVNVVNCDIMPGSSSTQNGTGIHAYYGSTINVQGTFFVQARYAALSEQMSSVFFATCKGLGQVGSLDRTGTIHVANNSTHMPVPIAGQTTWSITAGANVYGATGVILDDGSGSVTPSPTPSTTSYTASVSANGYRIAYDGSTYDWTSTNVVRQGLFWENGTSVKYYGAYEFTVPSGYSGTLKSATITLMRRSGGHSGNVTVKGYKMNNWTGSGAPSVGALLFNGTAAEGRATEFTVNISNLGTVSTTTPNNKIRIVLVADDSTMPAGSSESPNAAVFGGMADGTSFMTLNV